MSSRTVLKQDIEQRTEDPVSAISSHIDQARKNLHTHLPGIVRSYDPDSQTVEVQPAIQRIFVNSAPVDLPLLVDVPVYFPGGGDYVMTFPVAVGDECLLAFSERAIDFWFQNGGVQLPSSMVTHDLSDAFAFVGISSQPRKLSGVSTDSVEIRSRSGGQRISMGNGTIKIGSDGTTPMNALIHGVVTGQDPCPIMGATHGALGCGSPVVLAKGRS